MSTPPRGDWADEAVESIIDDMNDRSINTDDIDEEIMDEIRAAWASIIRSYWSQING